MYPMREFQEHDQQAVIAFMTAHPLGMVTAVNEDGELVATHVPLLVDRSGDSIRLRGHVMRKTDHWRGFHDGRDVLVAFTGPDAPIPESWLEGRPFGGTWNYMAVHARGKLTFLPPSDLIDVLRTLKNQFEPDPSTRFEHLPSAYIDSLIGAIEAFEIEVTGLQAVFKLSQNRTLVDFDHVVSGLRDRGGESALVADEMVARRGLFFPNEPSP
jgi:transcriptional regulator